MAEARLTAEIRAHAFLRRCMRDGRAAVVVRKGDPTAGALLIKVNRFAAGCVVYAQVRDAQGELLWDPGTGEQPVAEADADRYLERQVRYDSDVWILEIEDPHERFSIAD